MDYDIITLSDATFFTEIGKPLLPAKEIKVALPAGMLATDVHIIDTSCVDLKGAYTIFPAQPPRRTDGSCDTSAFVEPDQTVYKSNQPYPSQIVSFIDQTDLAGQGIAVIDLHPLQYIPAKKKLTLYTSLTFSISGFDGYICDSYLSRSVSENGRKTYENMIKDMVINPEDVKLQEAPLGHPQTQALPSGGPYAHVIITSNAQASYWVPLAEWHTKRGLKDIIVTTESIYANYTGSTNQQKIRNFVIDAYNTWGTMYFLMAGQPSTVPMQYQTWYSDPSYPQYASTPSDQYYSDFNDNWVHDVFVGRVTAEGSTSVNRFINKILFYEKTPPMTDYILKVGLFGFDVDSQTHCESLMETIAGYIPAQFTKNKVYDSYTGNHQTAVTDYLNAGQHLVAHADHGNDGWWGTGYTNHGWGLYSSNIDALTNTNKMSIVSTLACLVNYVDYTDCFSEHWVTYNTMKAGLAFNGNTRLGYYYQGQPAALSGQLVRDWYYGLFSQNKYILGETIIYAKHQFSTSSPDQNVKRHCEWEFNLLGEPAMPIWTATPSSITVSHPSTLPTGTSTFLVDTNVPSAYICLWKGNEVYMTATADSNGDYTFAPNPSTPGTMYVTVTKQNYLPYEGTATVVQADTSPPTPNPLTWASPPAPLSTSAITMTATTATDGTPPVQYFFDFVSGGSGGTDSSWQTSTTYTDTGLVANTAYTYQTKARDSASQPNEGSFSTPATTATYIETPAGISFRTVTSNSIALMATGTLTNLNVGSSGVFFDSTTPGGDGGINEWIQTTTDTALGLAPNTLYEFRVKARNQNAIETAYSPTTGKVTLANVPAAPILSDVTSHTVKLDVIPNANPIQTQFAIQCSSLSDPFWNGKYVDALGNPSTFAVWRTDEEWGILTLQNLKELTNYCYSVKARNMDSIETSFGPPSCVQTLDQTITIHGYVFKRDGTTPQQNPVLFIRNLNTTTEWTPTIGGLNNNEYTLILNMGLATDVASGDTLRFICKDSVHWINVTEHTIIQSEIDAGIVSVDLILNEFYLDIKEYPMYQAEGPDFNKMCGPAVAQMTLNYMWWNQTENPSEPPLTFSDQQWLYTIGHANNTDQTTPYLDANAVWKLLQTYRPLPYTTYGYNFNKYANNDQNIMLKQICTWINYTIGTYGGSKPGHPLHVPALVPAYGDYRNWMAVRGIHTDRYTYPLPSELTIYGFWVNDPLPTGIGANTYKTINEWIQTYYLPVSSNDTYHGKYVAICEPPLDDQSMVLHLTESPKRFTAEQQRFLAVLQGKQQNKLPDFIKRVANDWVVRAALLGVSEQLLPYDQEFAQIFQQTKPGSPLYIHSTQGNAYYAVPFIKEITYAKENRESKKQYSTNDATMVVILIDAVDGHFKEATWTSQLMTYLPINEFDARMRAYHFLEENGFDPEPTRLSIKLKYLGNSPYYPDWEITYGDMIFYIKQDGTTYFLS
ncbi:MAG: C25 family cysteine peptidase [Candidatus Thermoplasmatota archaeon]